MFSRTVNIRVICYCLFNIVPIDISICELIRKVANYDSGVPCQFALVKLYSLLNMEGLNFYKVHSFNRIYISKNNTQVHNALGLFHN